MTLPHGYSLSNTTPTIPAVGGLKRQSAGLKSKWNLPVAWQQALAVVTIILLTAIAARIGLGVVARLFFMASALACSLFYIRRSPWEYITISLWFWTVTPLARRLIDFSSGFDSTNFILATPNLLTLLMLKQLLTSRELLRQREALSGLFLLCPAIYGLCVNLVEGDVTSGLTASADWIAPLFYYFYIIANWRRIPEAEKIFTGFLSANGLLIMAYGLYQYFSPTPWDVAWVVNAGMTTIGKPEPYGLRIFGSMNAPGNLALWLGFLLLMAIHFRTKLSALLIPVAALLLLMTLVRSALGAVVLGLVVAGLAGRASVFKAIGLSLVAIATLVACLTVINPEVTDRLAARFDTLNNLGQDNSALERTELYREMPGLIDEFPLGLGIGAIGRGSTAAGKTLSVDSGPLGIYLTMGWVAGSIYLIGIALVLAQALLTARMIRSPAALALAAAAIGTAGNILFTNIASIFAVIVWICCAYAGALGIAAKERKRLSVRLSEKSRVGPSAMAR